MLKRQPKVRNLLLGDAACNGALGKPNRLRRFFPYFVSAQLAQKRLMNAELASGLIGVIIHMTVWGTVVIMDAILFNYRFQNESSMKRMLQIAAFGTVGIASFTVSACTLLHWLFGPGGCFTKCFVLCWNEALLPPFVSSIILSSIRASLEFSKFLLFFSVFEPVDEVRGDNTVPRDVKNMLVVLICLKYFGISLTTAQYKFKVYDETR